MLDSIKDVQNSGTLASIELRHRRELLLGSLDHERLPNYLGLLFATRRLPLVPKVLALHIRRHRILNFVGVFSLDEFLKVWHHEIDVFPVDSEDSQICFISSRLYGVPPLLIWPSHTGHFIDVDFLRLAWTNDVFRSQLAVRAKERSIKPKLAWFLLAPKLQAGRESKMVLGGLNRRRSGPIIETWEPTGQDPRKWVILLRVGLGVQLRRQV